jgi:hypothetical protein
MLGGFVQRFSILPDLLLFSEFKGASHLQRLFLNFKLPFDRKKALIMPHIQRIAGLDRTFGEGEVMNPIQNIGLAASVEASKAIDLRGKVQPGFLMVFEL